jgi:hypothetical protein
LIELKHFIFLQVSRDRAVKTWVFTEGAAIKVNENGYGSGYPNGRCHSSTFWLHITSGILLDNLSVG